MDPTLTLTVDLTNAFDAVDPTLRLTVDLTKAFDTVDPTRLASVNTRCRRCSDGCAQSSLHIIRLSNLRKSRGAVVIWRNANFGPCPGLYSLNWRTKQLAFEGDRSRSFPDLDLRMPSRIGEYNSIAKYSLIE